MLINYFPDIEISAKFSWENEIQQSYKFNVAPFYSWINQLTKYINASSLFAVRLKLLQYCQLVLALDTETR